MKFLKKINKKQEKVSTNSKDAAKEILHLVLMQDRANVSADFLELMKQEIIDVIKKYIDVDEEAIDVRLTNKENDDGTNGAPALYANIPILNIKNESRKLDTKEKNKNGEDSQKENNNKENLEKDENEKKHHKVEVQSEKADIKNNQDKDSKEDEISKKEEQKYDKDNIEVISNWKIKENIKRKQMIKLNQKNSIEKEWFNEEKRIKKC